MTNPPVPATPLDVEACVRLLREAADLFAERARSAEPWEAAASNLKSATINALALALPGIGKDGERLDWLTTHSYYGEFYIEQPQRLGHCKAIPATREAIDAARAAQPEETSADASQDCYACGHARAQHLNESDELDDCLDCHCSEFMQSPAPSPERPE